ncbi:MAG: hypothetical protein JNK58_06965 [Phycisphaerae bacterium]|nr:hypothetical protein [Phycisphaerae bacterium]
MHECLNAAAIITLVGAHTSIAVASSPDRFPTVLTESASDRGSEPAGFGPDIATVDVTGIPSWDALGSPNNVVMYLWVGPFNQVMGIGWDVVLQTIIPTSWRSEIIVQISDSAGGSIGGLSPGLDGSPGGSTRYTSAGQIINLAQNGHPNIVALGDGLLRLEFFESYDDVAGQIDGLWVSGALQLQTIHQIPPIPAPAAAGLLLAAGFSGIRRKHRL